MSPKALFLGPLFDRGDLIKLVSNVHPYVRAYVRPFTIKLFDFNEIWRVGRGRRVMHEGMQYDPIQGQGQEPFKVENPAVFKSYLRHLQWELATDHEFLNEGTISKFVEAGFLIFSLVFVTRDLAQTSLANSRPSVPVWG